MKGVVLMLRFRLTNVFGFLETRLFVCFFVVHFAQAAEPRDSSSTRTVSRANTPSSLEKEALVSHVESGKYSQVRMKTEVKVVSQDFFIRYAKDLGLSKDDVFKPVFTRTNPVQRAKSETLIRYQQHYKNLPVVGVEYVLQTDSANRVLTGSGKIISGLEVDTTPSVPESGALEAARRAVPAKVYCWEKDAGKIPKGTLAISFKNFKIHRKNARLVYRFIICSEQPSHSYLVEVDAHTGELLNKINNRIPDVVDWNHTIDNCQLAGLQLATLAVPCDQGTDGKYRLMCLPGTIYKCPAPLKMIDARRPNPQAQNGADPNQDYVFADEDHQNPPIFGEKSVAGEADDVIGEYLYLSILYSLKFYSQYFGWAGWDGLGQIPILNYVKKIDDPNAAAYYDQVSHSITFDPDKTAVLNASGNPDFYAAIGAGHEFTHGVIGEMVPGLVYAGETASLDESFADIMGVLGLYYNICYPLSGTYADFKMCLVYQIGHPEIMTNPNEAAFPTTYKGYFYAGSEGCNGSDTCYHTASSTVACDSSNYDCDPDHRNAKVQNYMFYLLASGGGGINDPPLNHPYNVEGIGPYEAGQIAFRTMLGLMPVTTYPEARDIWIAAAGDLYGKNSREVQAVTLAWYAVGIGDISGTDVSHSPADGDQKVPPWPATLEWEDQPDEIEWDVQTSTSPNFDRDLLTKDTLVSTRPPGQSASSSVDFNLKPDTNYYWRVRAKRTPASGSSSGKSGTDGKVAVQPSPVLISQTGWGDWSLLRYFKTHTRASTLKSPLGASPKVYPWGDNKFTWTDVKGGKEYLLQTSEDEDLGIGSNLGPGKAVQGSPQMGQPNNPLQSISLSSVLVDPSDPDNTEGGNLIKHGLPFALKVSHTYYWGVLPYGPDNIQGNWSNDQKGQIFETSNPRTKLASPENAATVSPWGIALQWEETRGTVGYVLRVSTHPDLSENIYSGPDPDSTSQVLSLSVDTGEGAGLAQNSQIGISSNPVVEGLRRDYYWSVTPKGPPPFNEKGRASEVWGFNIDRQATKPVLIAPSDGSHVPYKQTTLPFFWEPVDHAVEYLFTLYGRNSDGSRGATLDTRSVPPSSQDAEHRTELKLENEGTTDKAGYCWQVQAIGPKDLQGNSLEGPPSDTFCYSLAPDKPVLTSPSNGTADVDYNSTTFTWDSEWAPGGYMISITAPGFSSGWVNLSGKSYTLDLKPSSTYYWTVDAKGLNGELTNSAQYSFTTKAAPCNPPDAPQNLDPFGGSNSQPISNPYRYQWSSVPGAVKYEFTVYSSDYYNPSNRSVVYHAYYTGTVSDPVSINCNYYPYYWSVRAQSSCGAWSESDASGWYSCR